MGIWDPTGQMQVGVALQEALCNALFHGNLEVELASCGRTTAMNSTSLPRSAGGCEPYRSRRIGCRFSSIAMAARFVVADDGPGFDTSLFDRPVAPEDLSRIGGRGLLLIRTFMDKVGFNRTGNQISLEKLRSQSRTPVQKRGS